MKTKVMKFIGLILLVAVVGGGFWLYQNAGNLAKTKTEQLASEALGVKVGISDLEIHFKEKEVVLSGLDIENPKGFDTPHLVAVDTIKIAAESLSGNTLVFNEIVIDGTDINLEVKQNGTNFTALQKLIKQRQTTQIPAADGKSYNVIIKRILINDAKMTPSSALLSSDLDTFIMPDISMSSIGVQQNGIPASEAVAMVTDNLSDAVMRTALKSGYLNGLSKGLLKDLRYQYDTTNAVIDKVKSDFKKAGEELQGIVKGFKNKSRAAGKDASESGDAESGASAQ